jgi:hypothetical protein
MADLYHLSHFFEFLTGLYFGGLALLEFLQNKASVPFTEILAQRQKSADNAKKQAIEYFGDKVTVANGVVSAAVNTFIWCMWSLVNYPVNLLFNATHAYITSLINKKNHFMRRHFPVFFFTGCFCLSIVLLSALEEIKPAIFCSSCIDKFFLLYCVSTVMYQIWGVFVFPFFVAKSDYLVLTVLNFIICLTLVCITYHYSVHPKLPLGIDYFLIPDNSDKFVIIVIIISLFPILSIIFISGSVLTLFTSTTYFYTLTLRWLRKRVVSDIEKLDE